MFKIFTNIFQIKLTLIGITNIIFYCYLFAFAVIQIFFFAVVDIVIFAIETLYPHWELKICWKEKYKSIESSKI